ncbi:hypothetical protein [Intestinibacter bartlettii]|uniref:hypothetical protein n=1 Tax=Intestinibacter bartlettii TaxID=261299 RepID=UPI0026DB9BDA|nr:hypothetical protein [Intestinibacter bartlettii]
MPTPPLMILPKSESPEEFESLCKDVLIKKYNNQIRFEQYGRKGQGQNGIDIYGELSSEYIVAQCKNYFGINATKTLINKIDKDLNMSKKLPFYNKVKKFIIMTSMDRDTGIQNYIERKKQEVDFKLEVWFWQDMQKIICQAENRDLLQQYYPSLYQESEIDEDYIDIDGLKDQFNKYIQKYKVIDFLKQDPLEGIPYDLPTEIDIFQIYISDLLDNAILLQKEEVFANIYNFREVLDSYNGYLALNMWCNKNCTFFLFNKYNLSKNFNEIREKIYEYKKELDELYSNINDGCRLFY